MTKTMKDRRATAAQRLKKRRLELEEKALELGVEDVEAYIRATLTAENGPDFDEVQAHLFRPSGETLH